MVPISPWPRRHLFSLKFCYFFWTTFWNDFHGLLALVLDNFLELNLFFPATICIVFSLSFLQVFVDEILIFNIANFVKIVISPRRNTIFSGLGVQKITEIFDEKTGEYFLANRMNFYGLGTRFWSDFEGLGDGLEGTKNKTKKR